jgi:hypothetical protein
MVARAHWETAQRWYEVELVRDLLGDWVVVPRWGSKASRRYGELIYWESQHDRKRSAYRSVAGIRL